jgi:hypothetical protein
MLEMAGLSIFIAGKQTSQVRHVLHDMFAALIPYSRGVPVRFGYSLIMVFPEVIKMVLFVALIDAP